MDGWTDGWRTNLCTHVRISRYTDGWIVNGWIGLWVGGWTDGWMCGWMDRCTHRQINRYMDRETDKNSQSGVWLERIWRYCSRRRCNTLEEYIMMLISWGYSSQAHRLVAAEKESTPFTPPHRRRHRGMSSSCVASWTNEKMYSPWSYDICPAQCDTCRYINEHSALLYKQR